MNPVLFPWSILNDELKGMKEGEVTVFAAPPKVKKTWLNIVIASAAALAGRRVFVLNQEAPQAQWVSRLVRYMGSGKKEDIEKTKLLTQNLTLGHHIDYIEALKAQLDLMKEPPELILIDTLNLVRPKDPKMAVYDVMKHNLEACRLLALEYRCAVAVFINTVIADPYKHIVGSDDLGRVPEHVLLVTPWNPEQLELRIIRTRSDTELKGAIINAYVPPDGSRDKPFNFDLVETT